MRGCFCCCSKGRGLNSSPPFYHWALTGESLPITKRTGDEVFSSSTCKQGEIEAVVIATGVHSFFGKAAYLVDSTESIGHFQKGAITKKMTAIEEMTGMDVLRSDKTRTLTLNRLTIDQNLIEARANITEVHFLPFNPVDKCTAITYIDSDGNWYRASKGSSEQIGF